MVSGDAYVGRGLVPGTESVRSARERCSCFFVVVDTLAVRVELSWGVGKG